MPDRDTIDDVNELIRRSAQVEVPEEVEDRLRRRLVEFRTRVEQRPPARFFIPAPAWRVLATTAALVAVAVGLLLIPRESQASQIFASAAAQPISPAFRRTPGPSAGCRSQTSTT